VAKLKEEYIGDYGLLTEEEAKLILKYTFPLAISKQLLEIEGYSEGQLSYALDVGAYAMYMDYTSAIAQVSRFRPIKAIKAALDLWDVPDADDYRDEIEDGFDDLSNISKSVVLRYSHAAMGHGSIVNYFNSLK